MEGLKKVIFEVLVRNQETCKIGSDGDYSQEQCVFAWDFDLVSDEIKQAIITEISKDFEDVPDETSCKTVVEAHLVTKINKLIGTVSKPCH
jgi:hypothetical protein